MQLNRITVMCFLKKNQNGKPMSEGKSDLKWPAISFVVIVLAKVTLASFYSEAEAERNPLVGIPLVITFLFPT